MLPVKVKRLCDRAVLPKYQHNGDAGMDVCSIDDHVIYAHGRLLIPTGLAFELPEFCMIDVRSRSGLALKSGVVVANSPGTIDSNYRGELGVILINHSHDSFVVHSGDRIAQIVFKQFYAVTLIESETLEDSDRGASGFGSTGIS